MRNAICFVVAVLAFDCINAQLINWDALNGYPLRPSPPKRPQPPVRRPNSSDKNKQRPLIAGENGISLNSKNNSLNVNEIATHEDLNGEIPIKSEILHRPFEPSMSQPLPIDQPMGEIVIPPPPSPSGPQQQHHQQPKPEHKPKPEAETKPALEPELEPERHPKPEPEHQPKPHTQPNPEPQPQPIPNPLPSLDNNSIQSEAMVNRPGNHILDIFAEVTPRYPYRPRPKLN